MVGAAPTSAELTGQLMDLLPNIQCTKSSTQTLPFLFLTRRMVSLPRVWPHRDCYDSVHGTVGQEGWNFGVCWTVYTRYSGEVAQARWYVRRARRTGRVGGLQPIERVGVHQQRAGVSNLPSSSFP